jgi:hypothetical protein
MVASLEHPLTDPLFIHLSMSSLLSLPQELRSAIWTMVFVDGPSPNIPVLTINRQIRDETQRFIYHRPLVFPTQLELYEWLDRVGTENLHHVDALSFHVHLDEGPEDDDVHDEVDRTPEEEEEEEVEEDRVDDKIHVKADSESDKSTHTPDRDPSPEPAKTTAKLERAETDPEEDTDISIPSPFRETEYERHLRQIIEALQTMPNLRSLSIYKSPSSSSPYLNLLYATVLSKVGRLCPSIQRFAFHSTGHSLSFLKHMSKLQTIEFSGYSKNSPMETIAVLLRLRHLQDLELIHTPVPLDATTASYDSSTPCLTREVIRSLRGLKTVTIRESLAYDGASPTLFTPEILSPLISVHRLTLHRLGIDLDFEPSSANQAMFMSVLSTSQIKSLSVQWPGLDDKILDHLPLSLINLSLPSLGGIPPESVLLELDSRKKNVPHLREVTIFLEPAQGQPATVVRSLLL